MADYGGGGFYGGGGGGGDFYGDSGATTTPPVKGESRTPVSSTQRANNRDKQTLRPCTIKQIMDAEKSSVDSNYKIDGAEVAQVQIVGCIREMTTKSTNITWMVEDGTGIIEVKMWIDEEDSEFQADKRSRWKEGAYVRVIGNLRSFKDAPNIVAFDIQVVEDFNQLTYHMLRAMYTHSLAIKKKQAPTNMMAGSVTTAASAATGAALTSESFDAGDGSFAPVQQAILSLFKEGPVSDEGIDIRVITSKLIPKGYSAKQIKDAVGFLTDECHLYSTIDDDHFMTTT